MTASETRGDKRKIAHPENEAQTNVLNRGLTRRDFVKKAGKVAYVAPTLVVLSLPLNAAALPSPPPPPESPQWLVPPKS